MGNIQRTTNTQMAATNQLPDLLQVLSKGNNPVVAMQRVVQTEKGLTPARAMQGMQLSAIKRQNPKMAADAVVQLITLTAQQFNVKRNLTDLQIQVLAADLLSRYYFLKFEELVYVFREARAGTWGKVYDHLEPGTVLDWVQQYDEGQRHHALQDADFMRKQENINAISKTLTDEQLKEGYKKLMAEGNQAPAKKPAYNPIETPDFMQRLMAQLRAGSVDAAQLLPGFQYAGLERAANLCRAHMEESARQNTRKK